MKKKEFTPTEIKEIIDLYQNKYIGTPSIGVMFEVGKGVINRVLKENNIPLGVSGRKFKGGKTVADKKYYKKNKIKIQQYYKEWSSDKKPELNK